MFCSLHSLILWSIQLNADMITLGVLKIAKRPPDERHPFGYGKFESLGALSVSGILLFTGHFEFTIALSVCCSMIGIGQSLSIHCAADSLNSSLHACLIQGGSLAYHNFDSILTMLNQTGAIEAVSMPNTLALTGAVLAIVIKEALYRITLKVNAFLFLFVFIIETWV